MRFLPSATTKGNLCKCKSYTTAISVLTMLF